MILQVQGKVGNTLKLIRYYSFHAIYKISEVDKSNDINTMPLYENYDGTKRGLNSEPN